MLRAEVDQRAAEMTADAETAVARRFLARDEARAHVSQEVVSLLHRAMDDAHRMIREAKDSTGEHIGVSGVTRDVAIRWVPDRRQEMHLAMVATIRAQVQEAKLALDRQEAELLRRLSVDALETDAAREFLGAIPTVGQLVSSARLRELEAEFAGPEGDRPADPPGRLGSWGDL